ncbi:MAG: cysteine desulfurase NifS [Candidatus Brocadiales bacterium]|nr:cysteine desulfurase NifS [Candidatus Bathyanammoxibius amoris]
MSRTVYVDNNATTRVADEVVEEMLPYFTELYGNPSSMHTFGGQLHKKIEQAREKVADLIGADPSEITFTSCGTESDNAAIRGALESHPKKRHIVTTRVEHPAVLHQCRQLARHGYELTEIAVDQEGLLDLGELRAAIRGDTAIVSVMHANNETGVVFPVEEAAQIAREKGAVFHTDAIQTVGKLPMDMSKGNIDMLTISGHKLHAPKGVGALYIRRGVKFKPLIVGGHHENGKRAGTENIPYIMGLGKACELAKKYMKEEQGRVKSLRDKLEEHLLTNIPNARLNGHKTLRLPNTTNISFEYVEGEAILLLLDEAGICASSGSACSSGSLEPSHVLMAMGVPFTAAHGSIRFSLSHYNTEDDVDYILESIPPIMKKLKDISPYAREIEELEQKAASTANRG